MVDGSSQDTTFTIAQKAGVNVLNVKKRNVSYQRNYGAAHARGAYLIFLDADTQISTAFLKKIRTKIIETKGFIYIPGMKPDSSDKIIQGFQIVANFCVKQSLRTPKPLATSGSIIFEKKTFKKVGGFNETLFLGEDHSIIQKAANLGIKATYLDDIYILFSYRRVVRDGKLKSLAKCLVGTSHVLFRGDIKHRIYNYQMGGHLYKKK